MFLIRLPMNKAGEEPRHIEWNWTENCTQQEGIYTEGGGESNPSHGQIMASQNTRVFDSHIL